MHPRSADLLELGLALGAWRHAPPTPAQCGSDLLDAVAILREHESPAAQRVATGLACWLADGGDLQTRLGLRPGRGGQNDMRRLALKRARGALVRGAFAALPGEITRKGEALALMIRNADPAVAGAAAALRLPSSGKQLVRIYRADIAGR